jgi:hypothetical protein
MTEASSNSAYPQRDQFYAQKYSRLLAKICLANELGADACYFLTTIASLEDAKRYSGPINFYNTQLMPIIGQSREETFRKVRAKLMAAGWLHCEIPPNGARKAAIYWTTTPEQYSDIEAGSLDEDSSEYERGHCDGFKFAIDHLTDQPHTTELCDIQLNSTQKRTLKRCRSDVEAMLKRCRSDVEAMSKRTASLPNPIPNPIPNPETSEGPVPGVLDVDEKRIEAIQIPESLNTPEFIEAWNEWGRYLAEKGFQPVSFTIRKQLEQLAIVGPNKAIAANDKSIASGWKGIFPDQKTTVSPDLESRRRKHAAAKYVETE